MALPGNLQLYVGCLTGVAGVELAAAVVCG
jgi:hypothetical protein